MQRNTSLRCTGLLVISIFGLQACAAGSAGALPVRVGGEADFGACAGVGKAAIPEGSSTPLLVRNRPASDAKVVGELQEGQFVWMCDGTDDRKWTGILMSHREDGRIRCDVSSPIAIRQDYDGPCLQGWVPTETIVLFAG